MHQKFTDAVKGRNDGQEILKGLQIDGKTNPDKAVLDKVAECIQLVDSGLSVADATQQILGKAQLAKVKPSGITKQVEDIPPELEDLNEIIYGPLKDRGTQIYTEAVEVAGQFVDQAESDIRQHVKNTVKSGIFEGAVEAAKDPKVHQKFLAAIQSGKSQSASKKT